MLHIIEHIPTFLDGQVDKNLFQNAAQWILGQASWVIVAALVILGLRAWMNGSLMTLFGGIVVAGILFLFTGTDGTAGKGMLNSLSKAVQSILSNGK
ncbi:hypothetical protein MK805_08920 [Shimazuella sp. AN120528]|uniref:hypothetical protein n=1 Tax=Shimazuella soli TaxID=1892854 RepID=UPI001F10A3A2|nr:hypothetical protein [Shimazuella soli]MCH5585091.1 hypothetical protein [Shimazuella soli]